jgi:hypothetical protein
VLNHCVQHVTTFKAEKLKWRDYLKRITAGQQVSPGGLLQGDDTALVCAKTIKTSAKGAKKRECACWNPLNRGVIPLFS